MLEKLTKEDGSPVYLNPKYVTAAFETEYEGVRMTQIEMTRWCHSVKESAEHIYKVCEGWG